MTVMSVIQKHRQSAFEAGILHRLDELGLRRSDFLRKVYGNGANGKVKGSTNFTRIVFGTRRARADTLAKWATALEMPLEKLIELQEQARSDPSVPLIAKPPSPRSPSSDRPLPPPLGDHPLVLAVNPDGTVSLRLHVTGFPLTAALQIVTLVTAARRPAAMTAAPEQSEAPAAETAPQP